ncbi:conserved hypothetical protein [Ricinus communis]|uniref:RNase H type-1 domain-containing protein n=1 Tax=Ricinus communis TaxID=3988 RepID=B9RW14_RICCO|nr:conserved hypothetical protein [Ricinus communis]
MRERLFLKGIAISNCCVVYGEFGEHLQHLFIDYPFEMQCWNYCQVPVVCIHLSDFGCWIENMFNSGDNQHKEKVCMILWAIWGNCNAMLWKNKVYPVNACMESCMGLLYSFKSANASKVAGHMATSRNSILRWVKPTQGLCKLNMTLPSCLVLTRWGLGMVLRDHRAQEARLAEAPFLKETLSWICEQSLANVIIESDAKMVIDSFHQFAFDISEFGCLVNTFRSIASFCVNVRVVFVKRQANAIAKAAHSNASLMVWQEAPDFIRPLLLKDVTFS